ncbi:MAG: hypothetical protein JSS10_09095 [Verrucomicrobia bacterium]|nr:hypothetical protein [Verrucomicrobiota bacterium]
MSTTSGNQNCTRYCWGPLHIHPQSESLSDDLWRIGTALTRIPGFFEEAASYQDPLRPAEPLTQRVVDNIFLGLMALTALGSAPFVMASSGVAYVGEKFLDKVDILQRVAEKVQIFGVSLKEQEKMIADFKPLLELVDKIPQIAQQAEQKTAAYIESTRELHELQEKYRAHPAILEKISRMIARLQELLPKLIEEKKSNALQQRLLKQRLQVAAQISDEEQKIKALQARLQGVVARVQEKNARLQQLTRQVTYSTQRKDQQVEALAAHVESLSQTESRRRPDGQPVVLV